MGLYEDHFRFDAGPPDLDKVRVEAGRRLGSISGIEALFVEGETVVARCMLDPFTRPVVCAILQDLGGRCVGFDGGPIDAQSPAWARESIQKMAWGERMAVRYRWWTQGFCAARPPDK